jgi:hypothetical protein
MTKVILSELMLSYRKEMAEFVSHTIKTSFIDGVRVCPNSLETYLPDPNVLNPPRIEMIELSLYKGQIGDMILLGTTDDFGIDNIRVTIRDYRGNLIESGYADADDDGSGVWNYFATASVPSGTSVIIYATATDRFGAVGLHSADINDPWHYLIVDDH